MKCSNCNNEVYENLNYCTKCGNKINNEQEKKIPRCFDVFAKLGFGIGLASLISCIFFGFGIFFAEHGIVFSALGKKSIKRKKMANVGLTISIISLILNVVIFTISCLYFLYLLLIIYAFTR